MIRKILLLPFALLLANLTFGQTIAFSTNTANDPVVDFNLTLNPCGPNASVTWSFGDGGYGYGASVSHTYSTNGQYAVCIYVSDSSQNCYASYCDSVTINNAAAAPCDAGFTYADSSAVMLFFPNDNAASTYFWDFGDGTTSTQAYPWHTFPASGTYTVCLTITTASGCTDTQCDSVFFGNQSCAAYFSLNSQGATANFIDGSYAAAGVASVSWDYGDGATGTGASVSHTYAAGGYYTVCNTIVANDGCTDSYCQYIHVMGPPACQAGFYSFPDSSQANTTWVVDISTGSDPNLPLSYFWDFGDGNTSTQTTPTHTYANSGMYLVCVTISDGANCTSTFCDSVVATNKTNAPWTINIISNNATAVTPPAAGNISALFPNPATDFATLEITLERSMNADIALVNVMGQTVRSQQQNLSAGNAQIDLDLQNLPAGLYFVKVSDLSGNMKPIQTKLVKN